jgi:hypothetical protein
MPEIERSAASLVVAELGALRWEPRDMRDGTQMRDFDVVFADGHAEPLEVTTSADPNVMNTMNRMEGKNRITARVRRSWMVAAHTRTSMDAAGKKTAFDRRRAEALLVPLIEQAERDGHTEIDTTRLAYALDHPYQPVARELFEDLRIFACRSYIPSNPENEPAIWLHVGGGGSYGPDSVTAAVEKAAADDGNQAKLAACADAPRRHLFVVLTNASEELEYVALLGVLERELDMPPIPLLPASITTAWAGTMERGIYVTPPDEWRVFGSPGESRQ